MRAGTQATLGSRLNQPAKRMRSVHSRIPGVDPSITTIQCYQLVLDCSGYVLVLSSALTRFGTAPPVDISTYVEGGPPHYTPSVVAFLTSIVCRVVDKSSLTFHVNVGRTHIHGTCVKSTAPTERQRQAGHLLVTLPSEAKRCWNLPGMKYEEVYGSGRDDTKQIGTPFKITEAPDVHRKPSARAQSYDC